MKLAIIGTGKIVHEALIALEPVKEVEITAIYARPHSRQRAEALALQYGIPETYTDYTALLTHADAEAVYIGLVNRAHYPFAKEALLQGKHVILEKPLTGRLAEAEELQAIARARRLCLMEAVTVLHNDVLQKMKESLNKLGTVRMLMANFSQYSSRYDRYLEGEIEPAFDPDNFGGALYDINVYNLHYCVQLFGIPKQVRYTPNLGPNGVDTSGTLLLSYDGFSCVCVGAKDSDSPGFVSVQGEAGYMRLEGKPNAATKLTVVYTDPNAADRIQDASGGMVRATVTETFLGNAQQHRMTQEFRDFAEIIGQNNYAEAERLLQEAVAVVGILEQAREGIKSAKSAKSAKNAKDAKDAKNAK